MYDSIKLSAIMVAIFLAQISVEGFTDSFVLVSSDAAERPWTLVTSMFLHGGVTHLLSNLFALLLFGTIFESIVARTRFLLLYFSAGIVASLATLLFYEASLGASGAIFGVLGALAVIRPKMTVWVMGIPMPMLAAAGVWLAIDLLGMFAPSGTANAAHIAGLLFGAAVSLLFFRAYLREEPAEKREYPLSESTVKRWEEKYMGVALKGVNLAICMNPPPALKLKRFAGTIDKHYHAAPLRIVQRR